jgi:hypothetical protein
MLATSVRCPRCGNPNAVPAAAVPTPVRCPICGVPYVVPPLTGSAGTPNTEQGESYLPTVPEEESLAQPAPDAATSRRAALVWGLAALLVLSSGALVVAIGAALSRRLFHQSAQLAHQQPPSAASDKTIWTKADQPIERDGVRLKITKLAFGKVLSRNETNDPVAAGPGEYLKIYLEIDNLGRGDLHYTSWYGNKFGGQDESFVADLGDASGFVFPQRHFAGATRLQGHTPQATLATRQTAEDVLIFTIPHAKVTSGQPLWLELPADAFARTTQQGLVELQGFFRFEIPPEMLVDL